MIKFSIDNKISLEGDEKDIDLVQYIVNFLCKEYGLSAPQAEQNDISKNSDNITEERFTCSFKSGVAEIVCRSYLGRRQYIILKGSRIKPVCNTDYERIHDKRFTFYKSRVRLLEEGYIDNKGCVLKDIDDVEGIDILSPTMASNIVLGVSSNGNIRLIRKP